MKAHHAEVEGRAYLDGDSLPIVHTPKDAALLRLGDELAQLHPFQCARYLQHILTAQGRKLGAGGRHQADLQARPSLGLVQQ